MTVLYHLATLPPPIPRAEAIAQEISALQTHLGGETIYINPNNRSPLYIPRLLFGFQRLGELRRREKQFQLHHFYNPDPYPFPYLRYLRRPVIYSITCGVGERRPALPFFAALAAVAVTDERSLKQLQAWGLRNVALVRPGIETQRFSCSPLPLRSEIKLLVASAPWTKSQFKTKGIDALLAAAQQMPTLHLIFLWRGVLAEEMARRIRQLGIERQITLVNGLVDVNQILAGVHASITLAATPGIVKAYPHSLLDSLAAGKPVLVSRAIPMADYVASHNCGRVVETISPISILNAINVLISEYESLQTTAQIVGQKDFSLPGMIQSYQLLYQKVLGKKWKK